MTGKELREIREKYGYTMEEFAHILCLAGYKSLANIEEGYRQPSKLTVRLLRYLDDQSKKKALEFIEEFKGYEPK